MEVNVKFHTVTLSGLTESLEETEVIIIVRSETRVSAAVTNT